jgi:site-specific DNA recombinase
MPAGPWSRYDDGGYSGGSTDGPDLQRLLDDSRTTLRKLSRDGDNVWRAPRYYQSMNEGGARLPWRRRGIGSASYRNTSSLTTSRGR